MIHVDETDPVGEVQLSFPYRNVQIQKGVDPKSLYDLETEVGRGKFGTVYKCTEKATGLCLAAKYVGVPNKEDRRDVEREVEIMRELQHPRLIQLYDAFENGKMMVVILELIEGGELFERVIDDDFVLTEKSCTVFMRQICEGIGFIHKKHILHLDMKPENILCLTKTGNRIKIIDFGLARRFDPNKKLQVLFGTPEFVAPEVVNFDQIGYGTDMWSVGVICYVLLSGLSPFMGHTDVETMANVTIAKYDFEDDAFDDISEGAKDFMKKLLIKDMNKRLTAEDCINHSWLKRKAPTPPPKSPSVSSMDVAKDNLKQFVDRWNEHPNSPYVFETQSHQISPSIGSLRRHGSLQSLSGLSPSPCGSLASSDGSDMAYLETFNGHLSPPHFDFRRASDSSYVVKATDITERVNLAEEIRKLSDKLFQLSTIPTVLSTDTFKRDILIEKPLDVKQLSHSISKPLNNKNQTNIINKSAPINIKTISSPIDINNGKYYFPKEQQNSSDYNIPWRRTKFRITHMNRDVPLSPKLNTTNSYREQFNSKLSSFNSIHHTERCTRNSSHPDNSPNGTKNLLLKLLEHWDGPQGTIRPKARQNSMTSEYDSDSLGQRTISSLNTFFQSRSTNKKITPFHKSDSIQHSQ